MTGEIPACGSECPREVYNHPGTPHQYETVTGVTVGLAEHSDLQDVTVSDIQRENPRVYSDEAEIGLNCALLRASGTCTIELLQS